MRDDLQASSPSTVADAKSIKLRSAEAECGRMSASLFSIAHGAHNRTSPTVVTSGTAGTATDSKTPSTVLRRLVAWLLQDAASESGARRSFYHG